MNKYLKSHIPDYPSRVFAVTVVITFILVCLYCGILALYGFSIWFVGSLQPQTVSKIVEMFVFLALASVVVLCVKKLICR